MKTNKYLTILFTLLLFNIVLDAWGADTFSAKRELGISYKYYLNNFKLKKVQNKNELRPSVINSAKYYRGSLSVPRAPQWPSYDSVLGEFIRVRNTSMLKINTNFPRRIFWFFPDDGCYVRAALMNRLSRLANKTTPGKVFAFGNLRIRTNKSPRGAVGWWYHVAPIVQVGGNKYVFDPSMESLRPLSLDEWVGRMGDPKKIKVAVCSSGAYVPSSVCATVSRGESYAIKHADSYLDKEWNRIIELKRNPSKDLGPNPPWNINLNPLLKLSL